LGNPCRSCRTFGDTDSSTLGAVVGPGDILNGDAIIDALELQSRSVVSELKNEEWRYLFQAETSPTVSLPTPPQHAMDPFVASESAVSDDDDLGYPCYLSLEFLVMVFFFVSFESP
jgi:hypothetical protein